MPYGMMSPTRAPEQAPGGSPDAFSLDISLCDLPMDIVPPSPTGKQSKKQRVTHIPFLYTATAKKAFDESSNRPGSADMFGGRRHGKTHSLMSPTKKGGSSVGDGRQSADPMRIEMQNTTLQGLLHRRSMSKSKMIGGVEQKRPELWVLEAEQRALEGEQKSMERSAFERKMSEAAIHVQHLTKQYNDFKKQRMDFEREMALLHDRKAAVDAEAQGEEHRKAAHNALRIQDLEAKLEYWTRALREEEAYTKTLQHMKARSAAEKHARDIETANFKQNLQNHEHDLQMLTIRYQDAKNERDAAEKRISDYWDEMEMYRNRRDTRLGERSHQVQQMQARDAAMRKLQAEEEELNRKRQKEEAEANKESMKTARAREKFLAHLDEGFTKMMSISGIQTVQELEESFLNRAEREGKFEALLERNKDRINELTDVRQDLDLELLKIKFSGSANDAERDEIEQCQQEIANVKRRVHERKMKQAATESALIRVRSAFEYLAIKLTEIDLEEDEANEILAQAEAKDAASAPARREDPAEEDRGEEDSDAEAQDAGAVREASDGDLSLEVGGQDMSQIDEGDPTIGPGEGAGDGMNSKEIKLEMKKVRDPKTGVIAKLRESMAKLNYIYSYLEERTKGGIAPQTKQNAEAKVSGAKNLKVTLADAKHNYRIPLHRGGNTPRRDDNEDDGADFEDRGTIKNKAERFVARKKREEAARFDEFGNEIIQPVKKEEKSKKR